MTVAASDVVGVHRSAPVWITVILLFFLGLTALAGGAALIFGDAGSFAPPAEWLEAVPMVNSWLVPGLVLGIGFGVGSLLTGYGVLQRPEWGWAGSLQRVTGHHWSWAATIVIGVGHVIWIGLEMIYLPELSILQAIYGPLGLALALLPFAPSVSTYLETG
jgi:hypothetical protein